MALRFPFVTKDLLAEKSPKVFPRFSGEGKTIKIRWPLGSNMPAIRGKWKRLPNGCIEATYTDDELKKCIEVGDLISEPELKQV